MAMNVHKYYLRHVRHVFSCSFAHEMNFVRQGQRGKNYQICGPLIVFFINDTKCETFVVCICKMIHIATN